MQSNVLVQPLSPAHPILSRTPKTRCFTFGLGHPFWLRWRFREESNKLEESGDCEVSVKFALAVRIPDHTLFPFRIAATCFYYRHNHHCYKREHGLPHNASPPPQSLT